MIIETLTNYIICESILSKDFSNWDVLFDEILILYFSNFTITNFQKFEVEMNTIQYIVLTSCVNILCFVFVSLKRHIA